mmetsp:Transcript_135613/g.377697  ORF Transcript_135613/g.377697 Transcript_135613/m.377697 type:complete len:294 (+) Transcript_135613:217-1098(+)
MGKLNHQKPCGISRPITTAGRAMLVSGPPPSPNRSGWRLPTLRRPVRLGVADNEFHVVQDLLQCLSSRLWYRMVHKVHEEQQDDSKRQEAKTVQGACHGQKRLTCNEICQPIAARSHCTAHRTFVLWEKLRRQQPRYRAQSNAEACNKADHSKHCSWCRPKATGAREYKSEDQGTQQHANAGGQEQCAPARSVHQISGQQRDKHIAHIHEEGDEVDRGYRYPILHEERRRVVEDVVDATELLDHGAADADHQARADTRIAENLAHAASGRGAGLGVHEVQLLCHADVVLELST